MEKNLERLANHRCFLKLLNEIVEVYGRICDLRPVPEEQDDDGLAEIDKIASAVYGKVQKEIDGIVSRYVK
jgi:hypothetical protein